MALHEASFLTVSMGEDGQHDHNLRKRETKQAAPP